MRPRFSEARACTLLRFLLVLLFGLGSVQAAAQTFTVSIAPENGGSIGNVESAASGNTEYSISAANGTVTRIAGTGTPINAQSTRALVTLTCSGSGNACSGGSGNGTLTVTVTISAGTFSGRTAALKNFRVSAASGSATPSVTQGSGSSLQFTLTANYKAAAQSFYVGGDFTVTNTGNSGTASAAYTVALSAPYAANASSAFTASVRRGISLSEDSALSFGTMVRPTSGTTTVTISEINGSRSFSGGNGTGAGGTVSRATYTITGESGQVVSINLGSPTMTLNRSGGGGSITVNLIRSGTSATLSGGSAATAGTATFGVGGNFDMTSGTPTGTYTGNYTVTVNYN